MSIDPILRTKLFMPPLRASTISRPGLVEHINQNITNKVLLISAPAGFGKSTLLAEWTAQATLPVCWLSLDQTENDPVNFLSYLISSIQSSYEDLGDSILNALRTPGSPSVKGLLSALVNEISEHTKDFVLILDDFHHIQDQAVIDLVCHLVTHQPAQLHLLIASRADLPFSCSRLRAQGNLIDIGITALRFTTDESIEYLGKQLGDRVSEKDAEILSKRTEGWIAGLHMAVLSMKSSKNIPQYVAQFSAQNQYITDYLLDEILLQQTDDVKEFLLVTSILNKFTAPLCDYLLEKNNSQEKIDNLVRSGLFTIPLDTSRTWFRYHHLFSELLQIRLGKSSEFSTNSIHRKASDWFANKEMLEDSIDHAFAIQDYDLVIQRIEKSLDLIMAQGKFRNYLAWVERIPHEMLLEKPMLDVVKIFMLHEMGRLDERIQHQKNVEKHLGPIPENLNEYSAEKIVNHGVLAAIKTLVYASSDFSIDSAYKNADLANQLLSKNNNIWRTLSAGAIPFMNRALGNYDMAISGFSGVLEQVLDTNFFFQAFITYSALTKAYLETNKLKLAMLTCQRAIDLDVQYGGNFPFAKLIYLLMGELMYQNGQLNSAEAYIEQGLDHVIRHGDVYSIIDGYSILMLIQIAKGEQEQALALIDEMKGVLNEYSPSPNALTIINSWETYASVLLGQWKQDNNLIYEPELDIYEGQHLFELENHAYVGIYRVSQNPITVYSDFLGITAARLYLATDKLEEGLTIIERILSDMPMSGCTKYQIESKIVKALILDRLDKTPEAIQILYASIQVAAIEGYSQVFINEGMAIERLLQEVKKVASVNIEEQVFILQLLENIYLQARQRPEKHEAGIESLTPREIEVLKCLASGSSYALAAETLSISRNTLKTHTKRIYQKLGVNGLLQALNKAKELNII